MTKFIFIIFYFISLQTIMANGRSPAIDSYKEYSASNLKNAKVVKVKYKNFSKKNKITNNNSYSKWPNTGMLFLLALLPFFLSYIVLLKTKNNDDKEIDKSNIVSLEDHKKKKISDDDDQKKAG